MLRSSRMVDSSFLQDALLAMNYTERGRFKYSTNLVRFRVQNYTVRFVALRDRGVGGHRLGLFWGTKKKELSRDVLHSLVDQT